MMSDNKCPYCKKQIEHPVTEKICSIKYDVKKRKKCWCGCGGKKTHRGMANGVCLTTACHLAILRWVKTGYVMQRTT